MRTVTFLNQKGGVGKTSTTFHLAGTLSRSGKRVLLIDNDPQASLTQGFFGPSGLAKVAPEASVSALYVPDSAPVPDLVLVPTGVPGVTLVPGAEGALNRYNVSDGAAWADGQWCLREFLSVVSGDFDLALIDCPPNLQLCSWAALVGSDAVVVPLQPEDFGSQGLKPVNRAIASARPLNPSLSLAGYLLTMVDRRYSVHTSYEIKIRELYGPRVFSNVVPRAKDFPEAVGARLPVSLYKPRSAAAKSVQALADELLTRVDLAPGEVAA
jgi:chromosome partitioning protein